MSARLRMARRLLVELRAALNPQSTFAVQRLIPDLPVRDDDPAAPLIDPAETGLNPGAERQIQTQTLENKQAASG